MYRYLTGRFIRIRRMVAKKYMPMVWAKKRTMLFGFRVVENMRKNCLLINQVTL